VDDPLLFVRLAYPWGQPGTPLADHDGPDAWQVEVLEHIRACLHDPTHDGAIRIGIASGHGIGKGALSAWLIQWYMTTRPRPQIVVTANTAPQLRTKTWRELALWHERLLWRDWFRWTSERYARVDAPETWFAAALAWQAQRPEAFQGTHAPYVLVLYDEASAIADPIWDATEGAMTTPGALWCAFGNPTRNSGRFKELFPGGRFAHRWWTQQVDSRTCKMTDKAQIAQWITDYGEDSDFLRIRVKGQFPRTASTQFIGEDLVREAQLRWAESARLVGRDPTSTASAPLLPAGDSTAAVVIGVDVARYGGDRSVIIVRKGPLLLATRVYRELSTVQLAGFVAEAIQTFQPQAVFVDTVGIGAGVYDQVTALGYDAIEVNAGLPAQDAAHYANWRAEMWDGMRQWLRTRACLDPNDTALPPDLTGIEYGYDIKGRLQLERKEDMKKRGLASPDLGDALSLCFARPVAPVTRPDPVARQQFTTWRSQSTSWMA
jgi:hypothetical protein